jgi:acetyl esterase/lipase
MRGTVVRIVAVLLGTIVCSRPIVAQSVERDLAYGPDPLQQLDLSLPGAKGFPTIIFVHGGGLTSGDKTDTDYREVCAPFPKEGIACANVNYRLAPGSPWPAAAEDVASAVAWVRTHIGDRGGDPGKLFLFGHSSGAMLVALVGTDERYLARRGVKTSALRGVIPMGSIMWDEELDEALKLHGRANVEAAFKRDPDWRMYADLDAYLDLWPIRHVRSGLPPFMFLIAEGEREQPPVLKTDRTFVEDARVLGNTAEYRVLPGRTHYSAIRKFAEAGDPTFAIVRGFVGRLSGVGPD